MRKRNGFTLVEVLLGVLIVYAVLSAVATVRAGSRRVLVHAEDVERAQGRAHTLLAAAAQEEFETLLAAAPGGGAVPQPWIDAALGGSVPGVRAWTVRTPDPDVLEFHAEARTLVPGRRVAPVVHVERLIVRADASLWHAVPMEGAR